MRVRFAPRALSEAERLKSWWQKNRPKAPDLFDEEMAIVIEQIGAAPALGAIYPSNFGRTVRRLVMPKTNNHVYYLVRDEEVVVLSVWGAPRRKGPKL
ncbi:MAG TPA: type II toxin-antitoxin system RelE/ParE family toxin [Polyangiaceae bacterium]|jgi:plasmid stabilization system protein ParE|nr:type II toxin-antitoxin system RelE/ParE family toxin [Polyangiaceae bacterium]